jgi:hypothetical protein
MKRGSRMSRASANGPLVAVLPVIVLFHLVMTLGLAVRVVIVGLGSGVTRSRTANA